MIKFIIFLCVTAGIVYLSREPLRNIRSHGFHRFFAWEAILVLILLNIDYWFHDPFSIHQLVSWMLLISSLPPLIYGVKSLRSIGKPDKEREGVTLIGIEKTTRLVTVGAFKYIRHPLYSSLLFLAWGAFFKEPSWIGIGLTVIASIFLVLTAKVEESENIHYFGAAYQEYMKQTKMFIPFLF